MTAANISRLRSRPLVALALAATALMALVVASLVLYVQLNARPSFAHVPLPPLTSSSDPEVIARGEYLTHAVAHCSECHARVEDKRALRERPPLTGGAPISLPFGTFRPGNITPDLETGMGRYSDAELARLLKHGVMREGTLSAFMKLAVGPMADEDIVAIISYLRAQAPVTRVVPASESTLLGDALFAFGLFLPRHKHSPPFVKESAEPSIARGRYLAEGPALCIGCHTQSDPMSDMAFVNEPFSGGAPHGSSVTPEMVYIPPNLTPDPETGVMTSWSEQQFIDRMRSGAAPYPDTLMPWNNYAQMTDADLASLYRFLRSLPPVTNDTGPAYRPKG